MEEQEKEGLQEGEKRKKEDKKKEETPELMEWEKEGNKRWRRRNKGVLRRGIRRRRRRMTGRKKRHRRWRRWRRRKETNQRRSCRSSGMSHFLIDPCGVADATFAGVEGRAGAIIENS